MGRGAGGKKTIAAALATLAAPVVLYFIIRTAAASLSPAAALALPPRDISPALRSLVQLSAHPQWSATPGALALGRQAAAATPLAHEPYIVMSRAADQAGKLDQAIQLMEEARRRRPTYLPTRVHLMGYYARVRRFPELLAELDFALRKSPEVRRVALPELVKLIPDASGREALASVLARDPEWRADFFTVAKEQPVRPQDALALLGLVEARGLDDAALERGLYFHSLIEAGRYELARARWSETLPPADRARHATVFDGTFRGVRAGEPFHWAFRDRDVGRAEIVGAGTAGSHLEVNYFGGRNAVLAEQVLALPPGRYSLSVRARSETGVPSGDLYWQISCLPEPLDLGRVSLGGMQPTQGTARAGFAVPASQCPGQRLRLVGEAGDVSAAVNVQIAAIEVDREN